MCSFHIGQKVVYIGTDLEFDPNPGKTVHTIQAIRRSSCGCNHILIDVGIRDPRPCRCRDCGHRYEDATYWKKSNRFRSVIDQYTEEEIESVNIDELVEPLYEPA